MESERPGIGPELAATLSGVRPMGSSCSPAHIPMTTRQTMITSKVPANLDVPMRIAGITEKMLFISKVPFLIKYNF